ncbi:hypothetical protein [Bythopirellula polymerisocia]|uniref:Uncharacterized protein n=1 Tax=Bythopirellula polymerisocia TaxID=2528003 RepID=A0A5C6C8G0_9BACT|nr:hypothetical protein [Bythopirellula polymerisocia]TWU20327.1 hypothetical protein Pla144_49740 [Bythopirellula polymerisocia]
MTWHAQAGEIVLRGKEADIFRDAILSMCDLIATESRDEESAFGGARVFDHMTRTQQLASLGEVTRYLFHATEECLPLTAWSEATLASILHEIRTSVHLEIEKGGDDKLRQTIREMFEEEWEPIDWNDVCEWDYVLDAYESRFLWDTDFEDDSLSDLPPEQAKLVRELLGITDDYYASISPDLESEWELLHGTKRVWMEIDGTKR